MATQQWTTGRAGGAGGSRNYKLWVPLNLKKGEFSPLLMLLHGCTLGPEEMAAISGMNDIADAQRFLVVYPEQTRVANLMKCWNWFLPKHQSRDSGEPSILAAIVEQVCSTHHVDADRIYVAGVSAGGAMAVIATATYPDIFAGLAVVAGGEFKAATTVASGFSIMQHGGPDPVQQGQAAFEAMKSGLQRTKRRRMPAIVFHGSADTRVNPVNGEQVLSQWSKTNELLAADHGKTGFSLSEKVVPGQVPNGYAYRKHTYTDHTGKLLMEKWLVEGMAHAWPGGPQGHQHGDPKGPNASAEIWRFFCESRVNSADSQSAPLPTGHSSR